jgi:hypothetical protein
MKKRMALLGLMILLCAVPSHAQDEQDSGTQGSSTSAEQEAPPKHKHHPVPTPKWELAMGYTYRRYSPATGGKLDMDGWFAAGEYNVFRNWLGVTGELSGTYDDQGIYGFSSLYSLMVGPQVYPFHHHVLTPFIHFLYGEGYFRASFPAYGGFPTFVRTDTAHTWQGGGGLDLEHWQNWGIRLVEVDYGSTAFFTSASSPGQSNLRISIGLTRRFGQKK